MKKYIKNFDNFSKEEIINHIINYNGNFGGLSRIQSEHFRITVCDITSFINDINPRFAQRLWHIKNSIYDKVTCHNCEKVVSFSNGKCYSKFCSDYCTTSNRWKNISIDDKKIFYDKVKNTVKLKYGCDFITQAESFKKSSKKTVQNKYNVDNVSKSDVIKKKKEETCFKNYGVKNPSNSTKIQEKRLNIFNKKYGVQNPFQLEDVKNKIKETNIAKYGVPYPFQNAEFYDSIQFNWKKYILPSGKIINCQGFEPLVLDILLKNGEKEEDIIISKKEMHEITGHIYYMMNSTKHKYYPDIFLRSQNKIIEVKSEYYFNLEKEKNLLKKQAVLDLNYLMEFWIFDNKGKTIKIL